MTEDQAMMTTGTTVPVSQLPTVQTAIIADKSGRLVVSQNAKVPQLAPGMLLVKTVAVAINPADVKLTGRMATEGAMAGSDGSGIVVGIGPGVEPDRFRLGDRVCAPHTSMDPLAPQHGAFGEYVTTAADFTLRVPNSMSLESAATLGIGIGTIGHALFHSLNIPGHPERPCRTPGNYVLVHGGSTASGTMAIQLIQRSASTCFAHSHLPLTGRTFANNRPSNL